MVPSLLFDISDIDLNHIQYDVAAIEKVNPHRGDMRMLDGVIYLSPGMNEAVAFKDCRADEFWVPGHIPGRPIFPGVLMVEAAAQIASFVTILRRSDVKFVGFAAVDSVKFRGQVTPGDRLLIVAKEVEFRPRRVICACQGLVNGTIVFEGQVTGMPM